MSVSNNFQFLIKSNFSNNPKNAMQTKYFHFIYLTIILIVSILYFQKNNQLKESDAMIERLGTQLSENEVILNHAKRWLYNDQVRTIGDPYESSHFKYIMILSNNVSQRSQKLIDYITAIQNSIQKNELVYVSDFQLDSIQSIWKNIININANADTSKILLKVSKTNELLSNKNYLDTLMHISNKKLWKELSFLKNKIYIDNINFFESLTKGLVSYHANSYKLYFMPQKNVLFEGDTLKLAIFMKEKPYYFDPNSELNINGKHIVINDGNLFYQEPLTKIGKYSANTKVIYKNTLTGTVNYLLGTYEYEVLPKCRRVCQ